MSASSSTSNSNSLPAWAICPKCKGLLFQPYMLHCGHSMCITCIHVLDTNITCSVCNDAHDYEPIQNRTLADCVKAQLTDEWGECQIKFNLTLWKINNLRHNLECTIHINNITDKQELYILELLQKCYRGTKDARDALMRTVTTGLLFVCTDSTSIVHISQLHYHITVNFNPHSYSSKPCDVFFTRYQNPLPIIASIVENQKHLESSISKCQDLINDISSDLINAVAL